MFDDDGFPCTGVFAIQPDKKSPAVTKTAKEVGMIAGGTGEEKLPPTHKHMHTHLIGLI